MTGEDSTAEDIIFSIGRASYSFWASHPELEKKLFNESKSFCSALALVYDMLVKTKRLQKHKDMSQEDKDKIFAFVLEYDPAPTLKKGITMAKAIMAIRWLGNNDQDH